MQHFDGDCAFGHGPFACCWGQSARGDWLGLFGAGEQGEGCCGGKGEEREGGGFGGAFMRRGGGCFGRLAREHAFEGAVFIDDRVFEGAGDMEAHGDHQHKVEALVHAAKGRCELIGLWNEGQRLAEGPVDRGKACCCGVVEEAGKRHCDDRDIECPMGGMGEQGFGAALWVKRFGLFLGEGPEDAQDGNHERGHADGFMGREERCFEGELFAGFIGEFMGDEAHREEDEDQDHGQPVKGFGDGAVLGGGVVEGHGDVIL